MPAIARYIAAALALAMLVFSVFVFLRTGDWVAMLFVLGSLAYLLFFLFR